MNDNRKHYDYFVVPSFPFVVVGKAKSKHANHRWVINRLTSLGTVSIGFDTRKECFDYLNRCVEKYFPESGK